MKITAIKLTELYHPPEKRNSGELTWIFAPKVKRRRMPIYLLEFTTWDRSFRIKRGVRGNPWKTYDVDKPGLLELLKSRLKPEEIALCIRTAILDDGIPF